MLSSTFRKAATVAALAFSMGIARPTGSATEPVRPATISSLEAMIARAPHDAMPYNYSGSHSKSFDHLFGDDTAMKTGDTGQPAAYAPALHDLKAVCPAVPDDAKFDAAEWFLEKAGKTDARTFSPKFLEAALFAIGTMNDSPDKIKALTRLDEAIPDSWPFLVYMERKRDEVRRKIDTDPALLKAQAEWNGMSAAAKQKTLSYIAKMTLETLLPDKTIEFPRLVFFSGDLLEKRDDGLYGLYQSNFNEIYINGRKEGSQDFRALAGTVIHETVHVFEAILENWQSKSVIRDAALARQARFYLAEAPDDGAGVTVDEDYEGYRTSFDERLSYGFETAALAKSTGEKLRDDMFIDRNDAAKPGRIAASPPLPGAYTQMPAFCKIA